MSGRRCVLLATLLATYAPAAMARRTSLPTTGKAASATRVLPAQGGDESGPPDAHEPAAVQPAPAAPPGPPAGGAPFGSTPSVALATLGVLIVAVGMLWWFVRVFTTDVVSGREGNRDPTTLAHVGKMIVFCYLFTSLSLSVAFAPIAIALLPSSWSVGLYNVMIESPVAMMLGCVHDPRPESVHWELVCRDDPYADQWLINIGGYVLASPPPWVNDENLHGPTATSTGSVIAAPAPVGAPAALDPIDRRLQGGKFFLPRIIVHGGVTVPFYFILLSLLGAAVSMTRRVPEYQKRFLDDADEFWAPEARQRLVFQILQFLSAPVIAMTAYALIMPAGTTGSIALAFASGFSSESILLAITSLANSLETRAFAPPGTAPADGRAPDRPRP